MVLLAFSLPKAYEVRQHDVDKVVEAASAKVKELYHKAEETVFKKAGTPKKSE